MAKEIEANLCFCIFWQKIENSKWPSFLGKGILFFLNWQEYIFKIPCGFVNFDEIALSRTVTEIEANLCFCIFRNNSKIQNGHHFCGEENFFENWQEYIFLIPCGSIISKKSLYLGTVKEIEEKFFFFHFWGKFENSKWPPLLGRRKIFQNYQEYIA